MDIGIKQIEQVASLSRIKLTDEEKGIFREQLTDILGYIEKLNELDTDDVQPMAYATSLKNVFSRRQARTFFRTPRNIRTFAFKRQWFF